MTAYVCLTVIGDRLDLGVAPLAQSTVAAIRVVRVPRGTQYVALYVGARRIAVMWPTLPPAAPLPLPLHRLAQTQAVELRAVGAIRDGPRCYFTVAFDYRAAADDDPLALSFLRGPLQDLAWICGTRNHDDNYLTRFIYTGIMHHPPPADTLAIAVDMQAPLAPQLFRALPDVSVLQFERYTVPATLLRMLTLHDIPDRLYLDIMLGAPPTVTDLYELLWIRFEGGVRPTAAWNVAAAGDGTLQALDAIFRENVAAFDRTYAPAVAGLTLRIEVTAAAAATAAFSFNVTATPLVVRGSGGALTGLDWLSAEGLKTALEA